MKKFHIPCSLYQLESLEFKSFYEFSKVTTAKLNAQKEIRIDVKNLFIV